MLKKGDFARTNILPPQKEPYKDFFEVFEVLENQDENSIYLLMKPSHSVRNGTVVETELNKIPFSATLYTNLCKIYVKCKENGEFLIEKS